MTYREFFQRGTQSPPYPYQERFAAPGAFPHLLDIPTGAGKTAAAVLGWLWRIFSHEHAAPRRLVYCLPMRVLVEQTARATRAWISSLGLDAKIDIHVLMGGIETEAWYLNPEKCAVIIGTQDMLLSRALNRGYGATRFHWPIDFGLLNNDCLWVFDEPQLMGSGLGTSAQLAGLREALGTAAQCPSIWMSATLEPDWLKTIDFRGNTDNVLKLSDSDYDNRLPLYARMTASKRLGELDVPVSRDMHEIASAVIEKHEPGTQTLVVLNTVDRAKALYLALQKAPENCVLVHSRFRPPERRRLNETIQNRVGAGRILLATQVVEAGVDISSRTLITELSPWPSIVQRIGRCNRTGADGTSASPANVFWIDLDEKLSPPYEKADLDFAREQLRKLEGSDVSPQAFAEFKRSESIRLPFEHTQVVRRRDLLDLFDTTADLSGTDINIQRFVRSDDPDIDLQVFWRNLSKGDPSEDETTPQRDELCSVPAGEVRSFLQKEGKRGYVWDHLDGEWRRIENRQIRPGLTVLLPSECGGYLSELGWSGTSTELVSPALQESASAEEEAAGDDVLSAIPIPLTITDHTGHVCEEIHQIADALSIPAAWREYLLKAARWHDAGKAHWAFQAGMRRANPELDPQLFWAKSGVRARLRHGRRYFRHELAGALAALQHDVGFAAVYLIAAHHGRVRLSIRALPDEDLPQDASLFALGVHNGDALPEINLGGGVVCQPTTLDLSPMRMGGDHSWAAQALDLLTEWGPFRLAYLEALIRAADARASRKEEQSACTT